MLIKAYLWKGCPCLIILQRYRDGSNKDYIHKRLPKVKTYIHNVFTNRCLGTRGFEGKLDKVLQEFRGGNDSILYVGIREGLGEEAHLIRP